MDFPTPVFEAVATKQKREMLETMVELVGIEPTTSSLRILKPECDGATLKKTK
jgi:hypothetical protein